MLLRARGASQDVKLPLHYAAAKGASFKVTELLIDANRDAAVAADKAHTALHILCRPRCCDSSMCPLSPSTFLAQTCRPARPMLCRAPRMQDEKLPLHYAAAKGAPFGVLKVLLDANPKAVTEGDKARS